MKVQGQETRGRTWSVKKPNELNLVVASTAKLESPCSSDRSKPGSPKNNHSTARYKDIDFKRLAAHKNSKSPKQSQQLDSKNKSAFFQLGSNSSKGAADAQLKFASKLQNHHQNRRKTHLTREEVLNSHLPSNALSYLKMVDEPGVESVIQQFAGHRFQNQFRRPLQQRQEGLFLTQVRAKLPKLQDLVETNFESEVPAERCESPTLEMISRNQVHRTKQVQRGRSLQVGQPKHTLKDIVSPIQISSRQPLEDVRARPFHDSTMRPVIKKDSRQQNRCGKSISFVPPRYIQNSINAMQDSIESAAGHTVDCTSTLDFSSLDQESKAKVKELWYYNIDHVNYRPYYHERLGEQIHRKNKLVKIHVNQSVNKTQQSSLQQQELSLESQPSFNEYANNPVGVTKPTMAKPSNALSLESVIGSAFKVRDIQGKKLRSMLPQTTKNINVGVATDLSQQGQWPTKQSRSGTSLLENDYPGEYAQSTIESPIKVTGALSGNNSTQQVPEWLIQASRVTGTQERSPTEFAHLHKASKATGTIEDVSKEVTTQLIDSARRNSKDGGSGSPSQFIRDPNQSMKMSISASHQDASYMIMPMNSKIVHNSPEDQMGAKVDTSQMSGKTDNASFDHSVLVGKLAGQVDTGTTMPEVIVTPNGQKVLVSGSMTIKTQTDMPNASALQNQTMMAVGHSSLNEAEQSGGIKVINNTLAPPPSKKDFGGNSTDEGSIQNLNKYDSRGASEINQSQEKIFPKDVGQDSGQLQNLTVIDQPKAHVRTSQEQVGNARDSAADYEEFRQVGIISNRFSSARDTTSNRDSASCVQHMEAKGQRMTSNDADEYVPKNESKDLNHVVSQKKPGQHQPLMMFATTSSTSNHLKNRIERLVSKGINMSSIKNVELMQAYQEQLLFEQENGGLYDTGPEYIITHYSLPKALTRGQRSSKQNQRAFSQQVNRQKPAITSVKGIEIEDVEQFTFERENRQMLVGPLGHKLSKHQACRLQHNLNKRREVLQSQANGNMMPADDYTKQMQPQPQYQQQNQMPIEVSFRQSSKDNHYDQQMTNSIDQVSVKQVFRCQGKTFEVQQMRRSTAAKNNRKSVSSGVHKAANYHFSNTSQSKNEDLVENENIMTNNVSKATSGEVQPSVPRLQLNKVDLQLFAEADDSGSASYNPLSPLLFGKSQMMPWNPRNRTQFQTMLSPKMQAYAQKISSQDGNSRTTKMISINVQTAAARQMMRQHQLAQFGGSFDQIETAKQSRLRIVTQERSIQDTLVEPSKIPVTDSSKLAFLVRKHVVPTSSTVREEEDNDLVNTEDNIAKLDPTLNSVPMLNSDVINMDKKKSPRTMLVSQEALAAAEVVGSSSIKLPTSETAIGLVNKDVCDTKRSNGEHQRSQQVFAPKSNAHDSHHPTARVVNSRNDEDYEATPPSELLPSQNMPNKYNEMTGETPLFDTSQKGSLRTLQSRNQPYSKLNKDPGHHRELNVVVKTTSMSKPLKQLVSKTKTAVYENNNNAQSALMYQSITQSNFDQRRSDDQREKFYMSNKDIPFDKTAETLRYGEDMKVSGSVERQKETAGMKQTITERREYQQSVKAGPSKSARKHHSNVMVVSDAMKIIQTTDIDASSIAEEKAAEACKQRGSMNDSIASNEYVPLQLQTHDPGEAIDREGLGTFSKHTIYQLAARFGSPIDQIRLGSSNMQQRQHSLESQVHRQQSNCSQGSYRTTRKSHNSSVIKSARSEKRKNEVVDPYWLETYIQLQQKQHARKYDRELHVARQERLLVSKTAHLVKRTTRQRTPPMTRNRLLQVPAKPHNRAKVSSIGNKHAVVESVWAKNHYQRLSLAEQSKDGILNNIKRLDMGMSRC